MPIPDKQIYLIVGGDSMIGQSLYVHLRKMGKQVLYTTRRKKTPNDNYIYLDLKENTKHWEAPEGIKTAFFCAAITSIQFCEENITASREINVVNTIQIIERLSQKKIPVVFLSSNQVFDGLTLYPDEASPPKPKTEYGNQKVKVEIKLKSMALNHSIVRATKIIHSKYPLFHHWVSDLRLGKPIYPFNDYFFSPIPMDYFVKVLVQISETKEGGIWHVSGDKDLSYYDAALLIATKIGADQTLVRYHNAKEKLKGIYYTQSTSLKCSRLEYVFGTLLPETGETIKNAIPNLEAGLKG